jgi:hypothetical protein
MFVDSERIDRNMREVEAEAVALICCETLALDGADFARGYIQHWIQGEREIPNHSASRIFAAASTIVKAGRCSGGALWPARRPVGCEI